MREPHLKIGFIIFNNDWKEELRSINGHRKTAFEWIKKNNLLDVFKSVLGTNRIYDEEDFLMEYIGAIKLYAYDGKLYCVIPKILNICKNYFEKYFEKLGYEVISHGGYNEEKPKMKYLKNEYNKTIVKKFNKDLMYNPLKDGD